MRNLIVVATLLAGCHIGTRLENYPAAHSPVGTITDIRSTDGSRLRGELLSVSGDGMLVSADQRIVWISSPAIRRAEFSGTALRIGRPTSLLEDKLVTRLRPRSRFPAGLSDDVLERLLAAHGQSAPDSLTADPAS